LKEKKSAKRNFGLKWLENWTGQAGPVDLLGKFG